MTTTRRTPRRRCAQVIQFGPVVLACTEPTAEHDVHVHREKGRQVWVMWVTPTNG